MNGRKRHLLVDVMGMLLAVKVHAANVQDYEGAKLLLEPLKGVFKRLAKIWADGMYKNVVSWVKEQLGVELEIVEREAGQKGFKVLPRRWVVERTIAWLGRDRRLSKDYEALPESSEAWIYLSMTRLMLHRLAPH